MFRKSKIIFIATIFVLLLFFSACYSPTAEPEEENAEHELVNETLIVFKNFEANEELIIFNSLEAFRNKEALQTLSAARDALAADRGWFEEHIQSGGAGFFAIDEEDAHPALVLMLELRWEYLQSGELFTLPTETTVRILAIYENDPIHRSYIRGYVVDGISHVGEEFWTTLGSLQLSVPPDAEFLPTTYPFGFDLQNPEGWSAGGLQAEQRQWTWMDEQGLLLTQDDFAMGNFRVGMTIDEAREYITTEDVREVYAEEFSEIAFFFGYFQLVFEAVDEESFALRRLSLFNNVMEPEAYATPRGLRVGDSVETLYELYGIPRFVGFGSNEWSYDYVVWDEESSSFQVHFLPRLSVIVVDRIVEEIRILAR